MTFEQKEISLELMNTDESCAKYIRYFFRDKSDKQRRRIINFNTSSKTFVSPLEQAVKNCFILTVMLLVPYSSDEAVKNAKKFIAPFKPNFARLSLYKNNLAINYSIIYILLNLSKCNNLELNSLLSLILRHNERFFLLIFDFIIERQGRYFIRQVISNSISNEQSLLSIAYEKRCSATLIQRLVFYSPRNIVIYVISQIREDCLRFYQEYKGIKKIEALFSEDKINQYITALQNSFLELLEKGEGETLEFLDSILKNNSKKMVPYYQNYGDIDSLSFNRSEENESIFAIINCQKNGQTALQLAEEKGYKQVMCKLAPFFQEEIVELINLDDILSTQVEQA